MGIAVSGLVSGMDSASIIAKLMELERKPVTLLENKRTDLYNAKAAWQEVSAKMLDIKTAANDIATSSSFASRTASFTSNNASGAAALTVSVGSNSTDGTYSIKVNQLAQAQKYLGDQSFSSSSTALGLEGVLFINGSSSITFSSTDTLAGLKDKINNSGTGVTASIINANTSASPQYKMILTGSNVGAANGFTVSFFDQSDDGGGNLSFSTTQAAQNASLTFDGVPITKDSNTVSEVITGATLNLQSIGSGTITMSKDQSGVVTKVQNFVDKYNAIMDYMKQQLTYDQANQTKGTLFGNATLMAMQNQLRSMVSGTIPGLDPTNTGTLSSLSQVGITTDVNNQITIDSTTFESALTNKFDEVARLFASGGSGTYSFISSSGFTQGGQYDTKVEGGVLKMRLAGSADWTSLIQDGNYAYGATNTILDGLLLRTGSLTEGQTGTMTLTSGVATRVNSYTKRYTEFSMEGLIYNQNKSIETTDKALQDQITTLNDRLAKKEGDLKAKFTHLEVLLAKMTSQQQYLSQQLTGVKTTSTAGSGYMNTPVRGY
jgi:flagellar hook-associated protein 2